MIIPIPPAVRADLQAFTLAYREAIYFTDTGEEDQPPADAELSAACRC